MYRRCCYCWQAGLRSMQIRTGEAGVLSSVFLQHMALFARWSGSVGGALGGRRWCCACSGSRARAAEYWPWGVWSVAVVVVDAVVLVDYRTKTSAVPW